VREGLVLVLSVNPRRDAVVERKGVPGETAARPERSGNPFKRTAPIGPCWQVEKRAEGTIDQSGRFLEGQIPHVGLPQVELHARSHGVVARLVQHGS